MMTNSGLHSFMLIHRT